MASQITGVSVACSIVCSGADQRKHQSSEPMAVLGEYTGAFPSQREDTFIWWRLMLCSLRGYRLVGVGIHITSLRQSSDRLRFIMGISITVRRHNRYDSVSNHQLRDCLLNILFRRRSKNTSKLRVTGLCEGNSPVTGEFPTQGASNAENVSIWWRHHATYLFGDYRPRSNFMKTPLIVDINKNFLQKIRYQ